MEANGLCLSPQEDIIAYFCPMVSSIIYSTNFDDQIEQISENKDKVSNARGVALKVSDIGHQKSYDYMVYGS